MGKTQDIGQAGEDLARQYLERKGYQYVACNWRCRLGEIDLIMRDGGTLVFVEVRIRSNSRYGDALDSVNQAKQNKLKRAVYAYQQAKGYWGEVRIDVIGASKREGQWLWEHIQDAI